MRGWIRRTAELRGELAAIAGDDPRWWLLAGGVALAERWPERPVRGVDAEPCADAFLGYRAPRPHDHCVTRSIERVRRALRSRNSTARSPTALAVTICAQRSLEHGTSALDTAAFAIGDRCLIASLDDPTLAQPSRRAQDRAAPLAWAAPFVCVSIGDDPIEVARHHPAPGATTAARGGLGRPVNRDGLDLPSGRRWLRACGADRLLAGGPHRLARPRSLAGRMPRLAPSPKRSHSMRGASRCALRALPLAYALGVILHRAAERLVRFSPTLQIRSHRAGGSRARRLRRDARGVGVQFADGVAGPYAPSGPAHLVPSARQRGSGCVRALSKQGRSHRSRSHGNAGAFRRRLARGFSIVSPTCSVVARACRASESMGWCHLRVRCRRRAAMRAMAIPSAPASSPCSTMACALRSPCVAPGSPAVRPAPKRCSTSYSAASRPWRR